MTQDILAAEQAVAGSILIDEGAFALVADRLCPEDFLLDLCRSIFLAARALHKEGLPVDLPLIQGKLRDMGVAAENRQLVELMEITPTAANCQLYADLVAREGLRRRILALCRSIQAEETTPPADLLAALRKGTEDLLEDRPSHGVLSSCDAAGDLLEGIMARQAGLDRPLSCGLDSLDNALGGGLSPGSLVILAGRPGMGKTTLGLFLAENLARQGTVLYVSLEMTAQQLMAKRLARRTGISAQRLLLASGEEAFSQEETDRITDAAQALAKTGLVFNQNMGSTVEEVGLLARSQKDLAAVVVDHLGLLRTAHPGRSRTEIVTELSADLKALALALKVPVIALSQLNRASEQAGDKRPALIHLRDSGSIEQDADVVMLLHREDYYQRQEKADRVASVLEVDFAKNRFGQNRTVYLNLFLATDQITPV